MGDYTVPEAAAAAVAEAQAGWAECEAQVVALSQQVHELQSQLTTAALQLQSRQHAASMDCK
jgi:multidrug resistance efflux pump